MKKTNKNHKHPNLWLATTAFMIAAAFTAMGLFSVKLNQLRAQQALAQNSQKSFNVTDTDIKDLKSSLNDLKSYDTN